MGLAGGGTGRRDPGPDPRPSPPAKAGGGCFGPGRPPPPGSAAAGPASGWREEGRSRASRPARPPWKEAGIWVPCRVAEPARGTGLIWPSSALPVQIEIFSLIHHQRNKAPESLSGLRPDPDSRGVRCPAGFVGGASLSRSARLGVASAGWSQGSGRPAGLCRVPHQARGGQSLGRAGEGVAGAGAGSKQPRLWGRMLVVNLGWESRFSF